MDSGIKIPYELIKTVAIEAQKRGRDGYGYMINDALYKESSSDTFEMFNVRIGRQSFGMVNCRAKPETEQATTKINMQPISYVDMFNNKEYLVHNGAVSESYKDEMFKKHSWKPITKIDSEALLCMCVHEGVDANTLSKINGGFAFIHMKVFEGKLQKVSVACKYQPLYALEVASPAGSVIFYHSLKSGIDILKKYYEAGEYFINEYEFPEYAFETFDLVNGTRDKGTFEPYFEYPNKAKTNKKVKVLCACSGGIDSTTSLIMAHKLLEKTKVPFDIDLVHFKYGHRGQTAEINAVRDIVEWLEHSDIKVNLKVVDLEDIYKYVFNVQRSQLINPNLVVETGTQDKLKSTVAWVPVRNMLFQTIMIGLAETYILEEGYKKAYIVAGWNQLSEEGFYPDNSSRFANTMLKAAKFGTLVGNQIKPWNICSQLLKSDQWLLAEVFKFIEVFKYTISCDIPVLDGPAFYNCNGQCGSTLLSMWAAKRYKGIKDPRQFRDASVTISKDKMYTSPIEEELEITRDVITQTINRIIKPDEVTYNLHKIFQTNILETINNARNNAVEYIPDGDVEKVL